MVKVSSRGGEGYGQSIIQGGRGLWSRYHPGEERVMVKGSHPGEERVMVKVSSKRGEGYGQG